MTAKEFDIAIVGAGPAGSTCAVALGKSNLRVALIDKDEFPRDKICGDCVAAYVPKVFNTISPQLKDEFLDFSEKYAVDTMRVVGRERNKLDLEFWEDGFITKRMDFDTFLFNHASKLENVTPFTSFKVKGIEKIDNIFHISSREETITAKMVIGCDGAQGITRQALLPLDKDKEHYAGAVRAYYKNVTGIEDKMFEIHFLKELNPGYFWIFPLPNGECNVGLGMKTTAISEQKVNLRKEMSRVLESDPIISKRFKNAEALTKIQGFSLPMGSRKVSLSTDGVMFCGDAGCLIEPLTGEGIGEAIISGRYAGWQAIECFEKNDFSAEFMKKYDKTVYDKLWPSHSKRLWVRNQLERRPWIFDKTINFFERSKFLKKMIVKVLN